LPSAPSVLFDAAPAIISVHEGPEHRYLYQNAAAWRATGDRPVIGLPLAEALPEIVEAGVIERFDTVFESGEPETSGPFRVFWDGPGGPADHWFHQTLQPWRGEDGQIAGVMSFAFDVTDQVLAQREAERGERRLRSVLDGLLAFAARLSPEGIVTEVNQPALEAGGLSREEVIGVPFPETWWWKGDAAREDKLRRAIEACADGVASRYETEVRVLDGTITIDFQLVPKLEEDGTVTSLVASGYDITDRKRSEAALAEQKAVLDAVLDSLPVAVIVADADGRIVRDNAANRKLWGVPPETDSWARYGDWVGWWPETGDRIEANEWAMARALNEGEIVHDELVRNQRFGLGDQRIFSNNAAPIRDADGRIVGGVIAQVDVTERMAIEDALADSEARFRTITEAMPQLVWAADAEGNIDYRNAQLQAFAALEGETPAEDEPLWSDLLHPDDQEGAAAAWMRSVETGEAFETEYRLRHYTGEMRWMLARALIVPGTSGAARRWLGTLTDIDRIKKAETHRELLVQELNHRVKNTLAVVQSFANQTFAGHGRDEQVEVFSGRLQALAKAHDLLTQEAWEKASLRDIVRSAFEACAVEPSRYEVTGPRVTLPPGKAVTFAMALHELCTNAIKYGALSSEAGRVEVRWTRTKDAEDRLRLTWRESGGPRVEPPTTKGFGSRMIRMAVAMERGGELRTDYRPEGLVCEIDVPTPG
jgi:PAS domain S-box-containing protein